MFSSSSSWEKKGQTSLRYILSLFSLVYTRRRQRREEKATQTLPAILNNPRARATDDGREEVLFFWSFLKRKFLLSLVCSFPQRRLPRREKDPYTHLRLPFVSRLRSRQRRERERPNARYTTRARTERFCCCCCSYFRNENTRTNIIINHE